VTVHNKESCSDHIIKYALGNGNVTFRPKGFNTVGVRYRVMQRGITKFQGSFIQIMEQHSRRTSNVAGGVEKLDETLSQRVATSPNMEAEVEELHDALDSACRSSFRPVRSTKKALPQKSVSWWT